MKDYVKPVVLENGESSEGVYTASGDCWTVGAESVQDWNGSHHVFEVRCSHSAVVEHISTSTTVRLTFNNVVQDAEAESEDFECSWGGNNVTVVRALHANAYQSGDVMTYKVKVQAADEATTKALSCIGSSITCTKTVNVQGNGGDGN